jgi:hypothetical protein
MIRLRDRLKQFVQVSGHLRMVSHNLPVPHPCEQDDLATACVKSTGNDRICARHGKEAVAWIGRFGCAPSATPSSLWTAKKATADGTHWTVRTKRT